MNEFDLSYQEIALLPPGPPRAAQYAVCGLLVDGAHHKQWCLEQVLLSLGYSLAEVREQLRALDFDWEDGIPP